MMCVRRVDLADGTATDHFFLRHPECSKCGADAVPRKEEAALDLAAGADQPRRTRPLEEIRKAVFPYVLDERTGLIRQVTHRLTAVVTVGRTSSPPVIGLGGEVSFFGFLASLLVFC